MTRFADPTRCPDCGSGIAPRASRCDTCGLPLHGPVAQRLFQTLTVADGLLVELRASSLPAPAPTAPATTATPYVGPATPPLPVASRRPGRSRALTGLSAASVPQILLGLGATCVLVAALVFLAVTWSVLGVGGRTATLLVLTGVTAALAAAAARRGLRAAAESLALVSLGLVTLDVIGADRAGWLGDLDTERFLVVLGVLLALTAVAAALASRRAATGVLTGVQLVAGLGVTLAAVGLSDLDHGRSDADLVLAVVLTAVAAEALRRLHLAAGAVVAGVAAGLLWLGLLAIGIGRVVDHATYVELWRGLHAWPALAAAAIAAVPALLGPLPAGLRAGVSGVGVAIAAGTGLAPVLLGSSTTVATLAVLAVLVAAGTLAWFAPRPWGQLAAATQVVGALWVALVAGVLAVRGIESLAGLVDGRGSALDAVGSPLGAGLPAPWLLPLCVAALLATAVTAAQAGPRADTLVGVMADPRLAASGLALSVVLTVTLYAPPAWLPVTLLLLSGAGFTAWWLRRGALVPLAVAAGFLVVAVAVALYAEPLTVAALAVVLALSVLVHLAARPVLLAQVAGLVVAGAVGALAWSVGDLVDAAVTGSVLAGLLLLAALGSGSHWLPRRWWACGDADAARTGLELGAVAVAVPLGLAGVLLAPTLEQATWAAVYLTLAGVAVTGTALARPDRRLLGWPGGLLLAAATWVRLYDVGVREPEPYTLPSAAALLLVGLGQLRSRPEAATVPTLGPGLTLGLVPSLVWALAVPSATRGLLLGLACLALVLGGIRLRWTAPVVWGAACGLLLVLRLAAPYVGDTVPRWVLIGAAGALLIATGVTWERRLQEARQVRAYVKALR